MNLCDAFKALGNQNRLAIVRLLLTKSVSCCAAERNVDCTLDSASCNFGEIARELQVTEATVSHHLKELNRAGIIERVRKGSYVYCRINEDNLKVLCEFLQSGELKAEGL